jgi:hypothetical protein
MSNQGTFTQEAGGIKEHLAHKVQKYNVLDPGKAATIRLAEKIAHKLDKEIAKGHTTEAFSIALMMALSIDFTKFILGLLEVLLALTGIGIIADGILKLVEWSIATLISLALSIFMFGKGWFIGTRARFNWWILTLIFPILPVFDMLPNQTVQVIYAWHLVKKRAKRAQKKKEELKKKTFQELSRLDRIPLEELLKEE